MNGDPKLLRGRDKVQIQGYKTPDTVLLPYSTLPYSEIDFRVKSDLSPFSIQLLHFKERAMWAKKCPFI